ATRRSSGKRAAREPGTARCHARATGSGGSGSAQPAQRASTGRAPGVKLSPAPKGAALGRRGPGASEARSPRSGRALDGPPLSIGVGFGGACAERRREPAVTLVVGGGSVLDGGLSQVQSLRADVRPFGIAG